MKKSFSLLLLLAACGDNLSAPDAHVSNDAPSVDAAPTPPRAVVVAGDFTAGHPGVMSSLDVTSRTLMMNVAPATSVGDDPVLRHLGHELLVVNRGDGNNVTIIDATTFALVEQLGTGASSNPQDVAVIGNKLYVPSFSGKGVLVLTRGSSATTEIDLGVDDPDGKPNCNSVVAVGGDLYVSCGLLDDTMQFFPPRGPAKVYVVNPTTGAIKHTVTLTTKNPIGLLEQLPASAPHPGDLVVPTVDFSDGSGCIERIVTGASPSAAGCVVTNADLGGFANRVDFFAPAFTGPLQGIVPTPIMYAVVPASDFVHSNLRVVDLSTSMVQAAPINPMSQVIGDIAVCASGQLIVSDTTAAASGLRVYNGIHEATTAPLPVGLRPLSSHGLVCY